MSMWIKILQLNLLAWMLIGTEQVLPDTPPTGPKLGQVLSEREAAKWDINVMPNGKGLPPGDGDVQTGKKLYRQYCIACHGERGVGGSAEALAGAKMGLKSEYPEKTVGSYWPYATTLFDFIRRAKPMNQPGTLSNNQIYALTAYVLYLNEILPSSTTLDAKNLKRIKMPNRDGFIGIDAAISGAVYGTKKKPCLPGQKTQ